MSHLSENVKPLKVVNINKRISTVLSTDLGVELIILPYFETIENIENETLLTNEISQFIDSTKSESVVALLTSPLYAALYCNTSDNIRNFKLWVPVKLDSPIVSLDYIDKQHAALLFFSKSKKSLEHTITRLGYTYCPSCERTTKDYGGKKHLYHEFGTMMPDVWRDITLNISTYPEQVINRLKDLFGLEKFAALRVYDQRDNYKVQKQANRLYKQFNTEICDKEFNSKLITGDCLENLKKIEDNSVDFCFADPPYNVNKKYNNWDDGIHIQQYFEWCDNWLSELARVLKPGCTLAVLNIPKWCIRHFKYLNTILDYQDWIVWEGRSLPSKNIVPIHYSILCFTKGKARPLPGKVRTGSSELESKALITLKEEYCIREGCVKDRKKMGVNDKVSTSNIWWDIHRLMHNSRRVDHPCQLPPNFMYRLISLFTYEGEIILDPFNGAGTTSLCAEIINRKYIGIELSEYYNDIAKSRHNEIKLGIDPFRKNNSKVPKVKNSRYERIDRASYKVSKKTLQLEVKSIADTLGRIPTKDELSVLSKYPYEYYTSHFLNWGEAYAAVRTTGMTDGKKIKEESLVTQLKML